MNKKNISDIVSNIDSRFIDEAASVKKKNISLVRYVAIAACVAVFVIAGVIVFNNDFTNPQILPTNQAETTTAANGHTETENQTESGCVVSPQWTDMITPQKYGELQINEKTYSTQIYEIAYENIAEFVTATQLTGYDIHEDKNYTVDAEVYSIKNINEECALAVRFSGEEKFYVYINVWYTPETLEEFIISLNLKENLSFGNAYYDYIEENRHIALEFVDFDDRLAWDMILNNTEVKNIEYMGLYDKLLDISIDVELLGEKNVMLCVTADGYIVTNLLNAQKSFFVGEEKAKAFADYIFENVEYKETVTVFRNADGTVAGKEESTLVLVEEVSRAKEE